MGTQGMRADELEKQHQNYLGFLLMGVRDLFRDCMQQQFSPGMEQPRNITWEKNMEEW